MANKKTKWYALMALVPSLGLIGRMICSYQKIEARKEQTEQVAKTAEIREEAVTSLEEQRQETGKKLNSILQSAGHEAAKEKFTTYTEIDDSYGLGERDGQYYIYEATYGQETKLEHVDSAYVLPVQDLDQNKELNGIFVRKDGAWIVVDEKGEMLISLDDAEVTETSKFSIKDKTLMME